MNEKIKNTCDLFLDNKEIVKKKTFGNLYTVMAGLIFAAKGEKADFETYKACKEMLHDKVGIFSNLRGHVQDVIVSKMAMSDDPEAYIDGVFEIYDKIKDRNAIIVASPEGLVMEAINVYEHNGVEGADADLDTIDALFHLLKERHPLMTTTEDLGYVSMLSVSGIAAEEVIKRIEADYDICRDLAFSRDPVYTLAQVLALSEKDSQEKFNFIRNILNGLSDDGTRFHKDFGLAALGAMVLVDQPEEQLIRDIIDATDYLKGKPGFKWYNDTNSLRSVFGAIIVFMTYAKDEGILGSQLSTNITVNIIEEIITFIIIMMTTQIALASSRSN